MASMFKTDFSSAKPELKLKEYVPTETSEIEIKTNLRKMLTPLDERLSLEEDMVSKEKEMIDIKVGEIFLHNSSEQVSLADTYEGTQYSEEEETQQHLPKTEPISTADKHKLIMQSHISVEDYNKLKPSQLLTNSHMKQSIKNNPYRYA